MTTAQANQASAAWWQRLMPYAVIVTAALLCHGFILTNDGPIWDGWYWLDMLQKRNWAPLLEYNSAQGLPFILCVLAPFSLASDIVATGVLANFVCLVTESIILYQLVLRLTTLNRGEALAITLLAQTMPSFSAAQDFPVFALIFFRMLFLLAALLAARAVDCNTRWHWLLRIGSLAAFIVSCVTNGALMPFYGGFYLLLLIRYRRVHQLPFWVAARRFVFRYPDLFLLPPIALAVRLLLIPQFGWYQNYNKPTGNIDLLATNIWSFFENVLFFHIKNTAEWFIDHPIAAVLMLVAAFLLFRRAPESIWGRRSTLANFHYAWFGAFLLFLAIFPLAVAGKYFAPMPIGETSRHSMLTPLPLAVLLFALLRSLLFLKGRTSSRWMAPVVGCAAIVLGSQIPPVYLEERVEWIFSRSLLHNARNNAVVRESSVIVLQNFSVVRQFIYSIYGFGSAFGDQTRLVTSRIPENRSFFTPAETQRILFWTTMIPNEFKRVDPSGQQLLLEAQRTRGQATDWDIVSRYLSLRFFGKPGEMDQFLASLCTLKTAVLKPATPAVPGPAAPEPAPPPAGVPAGDFTNSVGMQLVFLPQGWWASKYETTQAQYEGLMAANPSLFKDPNRPVECVSWHEATEFCRRLTESERGAGRLPSGCVYRLPTAEEFDRIIAEGLIKNTVTSAEELQWHTAPVGSRPPNSLGLQDAVGNVWEWCQDWYDKEHRFKVSKGGSWTNPAWELMPYPAQNDPLDWLAIATFDRMFGPVRRDYPDQGFWDRGFRCVLAQPVRDSLPPLRGAAR